MDSSLRRSWRISLAHPPYWAALNRRGEAVEKLRCHVTQICGYISYKLSNIETSYRTLIGTIILATHRAISNDLERPIILISHGIERYAASLRHIHVYFCIFAVACSCFLSLTSTVMFSCRLLSWVDCSLHVVIRQLLLNCISCTPSITASFQSSRHVLAKSAPFENRASRGWNNSSQWGCRGRWTK